MKIKVRFLQEYYFLMRRYEMEIELPENSTLLDLLKKLPAELAEQVADLGEGKLKGVNDILVNGRSVRLLDGLGTRLKEGCVVTIAPRPLFVV